MVAAGFGAADCPFEPRWEPSSSQMSVRLFVYVAAVCGALVASQSPPAAGSFNAPVPDFRDCSGGFTVRKAAGGRPRFGGVLEFQEVVENSGGWSQRDSTFTAQCPGTYFFTFHAVSPETTDFTLALMKNERYQVTAYGSKNGFQQGSNSALLYLNPGDEVYLQVQQGQLYEHPHEEAYTSFTGFSVR